MIETWYEKLDYFENPLTIKPGEENSLFGYNKEFDDIIKKIKSGNIVLVKGGFGFGKTSLLKRIISTFGGRRKLIYCSCNRYERDLDIDKIIVKAGNIFQRLLSKKTRGLILLLDEAYELSEDEMSEIFEAYMDNHIKSIVCITPDEKVNFPEEMQKKIEGNVITLEGLSEEDAVKIVYDRLANKKLIDEDVVRKIYNKSGSNPRRFLADCEDVFRFAVDSGSKKVQKNHLSVIE